MVKILIRMVNNIIGFFYRERRRRRVGRIRVSYFIFVRNVSINSKGNKFFC